MSISYIANIIQRKHKQRWCHDDEIDDLGEVFIPSTSREPMIASSPDEWNAAIVPHMAIENIRVRGGPDFDADGPRVR